MTTVVIPKAKSIETGIPVARNSRYHTIFLDCDGVLLDFCGHAMRFLGRGDDIKDLIRGEWNLDKQIGMSTKDFWTKIDVPGFWNTQPAYDGAPEFLRHVVTLAEAVGLSVEFCTKSSWNVAAFATARVKHCADLCRAAGVKLLPVHMACNTSGKGVYGGPGRLLVDDLPLNISTFEDRGGKALLCPQPWNTLPFEFEGVRVEMDKPDYPHLFGRIQKEVIDA